MCSISPRVSWFDHVRSGLNFQNDITDFLTGFVIDLNVEADEFNPEASNGNPDLTDLSDFPVVNIVGPDSLQVRCVLESGDRGGEERG